MIPADPVSSAVVASGGDSDTVSGSRRANSASPHCLAAAICSTSAWIDTFTAGTAILSRSERSVIAFTSGTREFSRIACDESPATPLATIDVPCVFAQSVSSPGTPPDTTSTESEMSALFIWSGPLNVTQVDFTPGRPSAAACFSTRPRCSITLNWR